MAQKIVPFLWFDDDPTPAVNLYVSLFPNSKIGATTRHDAEVARVSGRPEGSVMTIDFQLAGQDFIALNGGAVDFVGSGAGRISLLVNCDTQEEIDKYWNALREGGKEIQCGWLVDKYGIVWQIVPKMLGEVVTGPDKAKAQRVMAAMLQMVKIDIAELEKAAEEK